jgi:hypothetical protein
VVFDVVRDFYRETLAATQNAKSREDIVRLVEKSDAAEWVSISPTGQIVQTRAQTVEALQQMLTLAPGTRPLPSVEVLWVNEGPGQLIAVSLVVPPQNPPVARSKSKFGPNQENSLTLAGTLIRDTFSRVGGRWQRIKHEKLLPDQWVPPAGTSVAVSK